VTQPAPTNIKPSVAVTGVANGANYQIGAVPTATCAITDAEDGNSTSAAVVSGTLVHGLGQQTATCNYTDEGGLAANVATATYAIVDTGKPTITHTLSPATPNVNGWYTSAVAVHFDCADSGSGIQSCAGDTTLGDGADQSVTGTATDWAGLSATDTVSEINVDTTAPSIEYTLTPATPNATGWYTSDVVVHFVCTDATSGISLCPEDTAVSEGAGQTVTGTATDKAGNSATVTIAPIDIDTIIPTITGSLNSAPNASDWYNSDVVVHFTCADVGSGIQDCTPDTTVSAEGAGQSVTGTATDKAGNSVTDTVSGINIDKVAPTIGYTLTPSTPHANGWYNSDVVVHFDCADSGSGVTLCPADTTLGEGANQTVTRTISDLAGNSASVTTSAINIDTTAPIVNFSGGLSGSYYFGSVPAAPTCVASDPLSGLDKCTITGGGTSVGQHSYTATATDLAGNETTATLDYTVLKWSIKGFYSPVDLGGVWNTVKGGSTVPLKFEIFAGAELTSVSAISSFTAVTVPCPGSLVLMDAIELLTTGGTSLRYDSTGGQFIQNWATPKKPGTCAVVTMTAQDGSSVQAKFILK
jgi:hypothetical protein